MAYDREQQLSHPSDWARYLQVPHSYSVTAVSASGLVDLLDFRVPLQVIFI